MAVPIGRAVAVAHDDAVPAAVAFYSSRDAAKMRSQVASAQAALAAMRHIREAVSPVVVADATPAKALRFSGARRSSRAASPPASGLVGRLMSQLARSPAWTPATPVTPDSDVEAEILKGLDCGRRFWDDGAPRPPSPVPLVLSPALAASPAPSFGEASDAGANSDHYFSEEGLDRAHGDVDDDGFSEELNDYDRGTTGHVEPWLHPVLFLDVGAPRETRDLLEAYRVPEHFTYRRVFDRGVALYNPSDLVDLDVPLGGAYVDPWDARCGAADRVTLGPRSGAVLFDAALLAPDDRLGFWAAGGGVVALVSAALRSRGGGAGKDA